MGQLSPRSGEVSWEEAQKSYGKALDSAAKEFQEIGSEVAEDRLEDLLFRIRDAPSFIGGDEHLCIKVGGNHSNPLTTGSALNRIYKLTHSGSFGCRVGFDPIDYELTGKNFFATGNDDPYFYLRRFQLLNSLSDYQTRLEGIIEPEKEGFLPRICISQPYIDGGNPTEKELKDSFDSAGFIQVSEAAYFSKERGILLTDAYQRNVRVFEGQPVPFDAIASEPEGKALEWIYEKLSD